MTLLLVTLLGGVASACLWTACRTTFEAPVLQRRNYRGVDVPVAAGVVIVLALLTIEALLAVLAALGHDVEPAGAGARWLTLALATGFGLLGAFDDVAAYGDDRGFRGHLGNLAKGRLTTGGIKLVGGGLLALGVVGATGVDNLLDLLVGAALVALSANVGNLFDRAPGRCTKVTVLAAVPLVLAAGSSGRPLLVGVVAVVGAGCGLLAFDLREELMLGDAGANVLGAAVGFGVVLTSGLVVQSVVLVVVVALNVASERVSFSRIIDSVPVLRALDRLGRRPLT